MPSGVPLRSCTVGALACVAASTAAVGQGLRAYVVNIHEPIQLETAEIVERALGIADREGAAVVILHVTASGGTVEAANLIVQDVAATDVPVFGFVASPTWGPTALIALAVDSLFLGPGSLMGAASSSTEPWADIPPQAAADLRDAFHDVAQRRGLDPRIGMALVDPSVSIVGVVDSGEVLTLRPDDAVRLGVADGQAGDLEDMLHQVGLHESEIVTVDAAWLGITVNVANRNFREIVVYVVRSSTRFRLGMVTSMRSARFDVPRDFLVRGSVIRTVAEVVGSAENTSTEEIRVEPGLVIDWVIENEIIHSNYFVYMRH